MRRQHEIRRQPWLTSAGVSREAIHSPNGREGEGKSLDDRVVRRGAGGIYDRLRGAIGRWLGRMMFED